MTLNELKSLDDADRSPVLVKILEDGETADNVIAQIEGEIDSKKGGLIIMHRR